MPAPFFKSEIVDFSIQWQALLKGKLIGKIETFKTRLNFVTEPDRQKEQLSISQQWLEVVKSLFPLNINQVTVHDGAIFLKSYHGNPPFSVYLNNIEFQIKNLTLSIKSLPIPKINSFLKHYVDLKAKSGNFSLFLETRAANGKISGYAKPFLDDLVVDTQENGSAFHQIYTKSAVIIAKVLENSQQKSVATQINFSGKIDDPNVSILSIIFYFIHHGFIQALLPKIDQKISMEDVQYPEESINKFRQ